jgi:hypothetical protein
MNIGYVVNEDELSTGGLVSVRSKGPNNRDKT